MAETKRLPGDIQDVIEHLTATIVMMSREEEFYRRSAAATSREDIKALMLAVADDLARVRVELEARRSSLWPGPPDQG